MGYPPVGLILVNVTTYNWDAVRNYVLFWPFIRDLASGNFSIQYIHWQHQPP
jgi:predicted RNA-binding protein with PUA-like domain